LNSEFLSKSSGSIHWCQLIFRQNNIIMGKVSLAIGSFAETGLVPGLISVLQTMSIVKPTSIQWQGIPSLINTKAHHLITAQTGTGKTLTYGLPLFHLLKAQEVEEKKILTESRAPRSVIVVPNRELARQVESVFNGFKHEVRLKTLSIYSGQKLALEEKELKDGVDILIGTPDRIDKHRTEKNLIFDKVTEVVIDESDTIIDAGFSRHLKIYLEELQLKSRFTFVSATFPSSLKHFVTQHFSFDEQSNRYIKQIIEKSTHLNLSHLKHDFIQLPEYDKNPLFYKVLEEIKSSIGSGSCIVFCNNIQSARSVEHTMNERGYISVSLHGDVPNKQRLSNLEKFTSQEVKFLVCTDLGSRGLDFPFVNYVVQYDFPKTQSDYVHRAGRAGRAGRPGTIISFYRKYDLPMVNELKVSFEKKKPLTMNTSAFSMKNKEVFVKAKQSPQQKLNKILNKTKEN